MTVCDTVLYMDSDALVVGEIDSLMTTDLGNKKIGVARDYGAGEWRATFNMGVFLIHPNMDEYHSLLADQQSGKVPFQTAIRLFECRLSRPLV